MEKDDPSLNGGVPALTIRSMRVLEAAVQIDDVSPTVSTFHGSLPRTEQSVSGKGLCVAISPDGGRAYLGALTDLVEVFEDENVTIPEASESDVLRELMNANRLSQTRLAKDVGISQSTLSAVLNGTRSLTKAHVARLARYFNVPASVFLPG